MEPERKIEKLLRAYAKRRRADAGDAFKLHPATRRLLQGEVARRAPKRAAAGESPWDWFRRRWVLRLGFALVLCLGAALFWPVLHQPNTASKSAEAKSSAKPLGAASTIAAVDNRSQLPATPGALTNQLAALAQMDAISGPQAGPVTGGGISADARSNDLLAYSAAKTNGRATLFADSAAQQRREEFSVPTNRRQPALALAENAASEKVNETPAPVAVAAAPPAVLPAVAGEPVALSDTVNRAAAPPPGSVSGAVATTAGYASAASSRELRAVKTAPAQNAQKFKSELSANLQLGVKNSQRFTQTTKQIPPVLASFEVQQNGNAIAVVDRDGSIYNGTLQSVEPALPDDLSKTRAAVDKPGIAELRKKDVSAAGNAQQMAQQAAQNYSFRVSGANRSLKQNVVFAGNLVAIPNVTANAAQNFGGGGGAGGQSKLAGANAAQQQFFSNSRITGTVTIDNTNQIEINAVPENP